MTAALRIPAGVMLAVAAWTVAACESLGNPPRIHRTPAARTELGPVRLLTHTETVPAARSGELVARIEGRPHHVGPAGAPFVTLVVVDAEPPGAILPVRVALVTELTSASGRERHRWSAPGAARPFVALLGTRSPPRTARTAPAP